MLRSRKAIQWIRVCQFSWHSWVVELPTQLECYKPVSRGSADKKLVKTVPKSQAGTIKTLQILQSLDGRLLFSEVSSQGSDFERGLISKTIRKVEIISSKSERKGKEPPKARKGSIRRRASSAYKCNFVATGFDQQSEDVQFSEIAPEMESPNKPSKKTQPDFEDLEKVMNFLSAEVPNLMRIKSNYPSIHREDVTVVDNIRGKTLSGLQRLTIEMEMLKMWSVVRNSYCNVSILNMNPVVEDGTIRVRWRINYIGGFEMFYKFWRYPLTGGREAINQKANWFDGYSMIHVDSNGFIYKHVLDKVMPDEEKLKEKKATLEELAQKAASPLVTSSK